MTLLAAQFEHGLEALLDGLAVPATAPAKVLVFFEPGCSRTRISGDAQ
jgi:hypothetical protein